MAGCDSGSVFGLRTDVTADAAAEIESLAAAEPAFIDPDSSPRYLDRYVALLQPQAVTLQVTQGLIYELPHSLRFESGAKLIGSESEEGRRLKRSLSDSGMSDGMQALGFRSTADFWPPWCAAVVDGEIASLAFAARLSEVGAELGVATVKAYRGQGFAAAATCGWSQLPTLRSRKLFYSTDRTNVSSRRVVERLGLRFLGTSFRIGRLA